MKGYFRSPQIFPLDQLKVDCRELSSSSSLSRLSYLRVIRMLASSRFATGSAPVSHLWCRRYLRRNLSSTKPSLAAIVELCEDELHPSAVAKYLTLNGEDTSLIPKSLRTCTLPEAGGYLNVSTQIHHYNGGFDERTEVMSARSLSDDWNQHMESTKSCILRQKSTIFVEAPLVSRMDGIPGLAAGNVESVLRNSVGKHQEEYKDDDCIYEFRRYQLKLGYDTVPKFLDMYEGGLPSKLGAEGTDPTTNLITLLYTECGPLNEVLEIWRHGTGTTAMDRSRVAARKATEWRDAIANIAGLAETFTSTIHKPTDYSPLR